MNGADSARRSIVRRPRSQRAIAAALTVAAIAIGLTACSHPAETSKPAQSAPLATASSADSDSASDAAAQAAKSAFDAAQKFEIGAFAKMDAQATDFGKYFTSPDLDGMSFILHQYRTTGVIYKGTPTWNTTVTGVDLKASPPMATLSVCFANNGWQPVHKDSGQPVFSGNNPNGQFEIASVIQRGGKWLVSDLARQGKSC